MRIRKLDSQVSDKIAAGEVVERPASVVKELVENSIDSGAKRISIDIKSAGKELIRVSDDGCGIDKGDVKLAFERHATGKIRAIDDIYRIASMGFRGEALSSIAAISRIELISKTQEEEFAYQVSLENGVLSGMKPVGANRGTSISVKDLFYNTPARFHFLKSDRYENNAIRELVDKLAIGNPDISFSFTVDGNLIYRTDGRGKLLNTLHRIYGEGFVSHLLPVDFRKEDVHIHGYLSKLDISKGTKKHQMCFINGRYVSENLVEHRINEYYSDFLGSGQFPIFVVNVELPFHKVDVNVHPTKRQVLFKDVERMEYLVQECLDEMMRNFDMSVRLSFTDEKSSQKQEPRNQTRDVEPLVLEKKDVIHDLYHSFFQKDQERYVLGNQEKEKSQVEYRKSKRENLPDFQAETGIAGITDAQDFVAENLHESEKESSISGISLSSGDSTYEFKSKERGELLTQKETEDNEKTKEKKEIQEKRQLDDKKFDFDASGFFEHLKECGNEQLPLEVDKKRVGSIYDEMCVISQVFGSYILTQSEDALYFINQHYAHERILYEKFLNLVNEKKLSSQILLMMHKLEGNFELSDFEIEYLKDFAISVQRFPSGLYIRELPIIGNEVMNLNSAIAFIEQFHEYFLEHEKEICDWKDLSDYDEKQIYNGFEGFIRKLISSMACNMAIKENQLLHLGDMQRILEDLKGVKLPYTSVHKQAMSVKLNVNDIKSKFH